MGASSWSPSIGDAVALHDVDVGDDESCRLTRDSKNTISSVETIILRTD
jgi:hypothetical protein